MLYIFYHSPCRDGLTAAWAHWKFTYKIPLDPSPVYIPVSHYDADPFSDMSKFAGNTVLFLDYCPKREVLLKFIDIAHLVYVWDHHKTSFERIANINGPKFTALLDTKRSGAGITYDQVTNIEERPLLINYVEDVDCWHNKLDGHKEFSAWMDFKNPQTIEDIDRIFNVTKYYNNFMDTPYYNIGVNLLKYRQTLIENTMKYAYETTLKGEKFIAVNSACLELNSEIGNQLVTKYNLPAIVWHEHIKDGKYIRSNSLRSRDDLLDVSTFAANLGGGGHRNAAGFAGHWEVE